jgi:tail tube protein
MATAAAPRGKTVTLLIKDQSAFDAAPSGNWTRTFVYSWCKGGELPLERDTLLGTARANNRDTTEPAPALPTFDGGGVVVPLDAAHFGHWLKGAFGAPSTSGSDPDYVHTFTSGGEVLPHRAAEVSFASNYFRQDLGLIVGGFDLDLGRKAGYDRCSIKLMGRSSSKLTSSGGGTPAAPVTRVPFPAALPVVKINGTQIGRLSSLKASYDNKVSEQDFLGSQYISGHDLDDDATWSGDFGVRLLDSTYRDLGGSAGTPGTAFPLDLIWQLSASRLLQFTSLKTRLELSGEPVSGPGGINCNYRFHGEQDASNPMLTAVLKGPVASY